MAIYNVHANMEPNEVHEALLETFQRWISFALGIGKLGGKMLKHPSGKMASALRAEYNNEGHIVALWIDPESEGAMTNDYLSQGHGAIHLKEKMLQAGKPGVRRSAEGYLYRYVPISNNPRSPTQSYAEKLRIKNFFTSRETPQGGILSINKHLGRMWVSEYKRAHTSSDKIRTMSEAPGSAGWVVPAMPAFRVSKLLKEMLPNKLKDRVIT